ncbi:MAG: hypothetical protein AB1505_05575 [Candidatus Latescibacterota bacterium]
MDDPRVITNESVEVRCGADGTGLALVDRRRGAVWHLDEATRTWRSAQDRGTRRLGPGRATRLSDDCLRLEFQAGAERLAFTWQLLPDGVEVTLACEPDSGGVQGVALPGSFYPASGPLRLALPVMQGVLFGGHGAPFEEELRYGGHASLSMAMLGYLGASASLLLSVESLWDWSAAVGQTPEGRPQACAVQGPSLQRLHYPRTVRLLPTDPGLVPLCKRYRRRVQERGGWKSWEEKVAEKPSLERLFGALMAFIGYNQAPLDYVAQCRRLRQAGFDRAFLYPVRFSTYSQDFRMGGDLPIDLGDEEIARIRALGYDVAPWSWVYEALDDGTEQVHRGYLLDAAGQRLPGWRIDDYQWYLCCTPFQTEFVRRQYRGPMAAMTWTHYDVNATVGPRECHALEHPWHAGRALDRREDHEFLRELLGPRTNGDRAVSSEGFRDSLADVYDIGTTKLVPAWGEAPCWTVPMTLLVYHDSLIHDWWEVHNYNAAGGFAHASRWGRWCDGFAREKAAMDALYGCPPNVFPFGRQYRWVDRATHRTESYAVSLDDPAVQEALQAALPVARLHRHVGRQELLSHEFLSEDGSLQASVFADGTRVVANFATQAQELSGVGLLDGRSWRRLP